MSPLLEVRNLSVCYGAIEAVRDISFTVDEGQIVCLIGSNGAGKTTTLRTISGLLKPESGEIWFEGKRIDTTPAHEVLTRGLAHSPEGRRIFPRLTVEDNLMLGAFARRDRAGVAQDLERVFNLFDILRSRRSQPAGTFSGGEQQMLAIGRALMANPRLLLLDEVSLGLAPIVVRRIYEALPAIRAAGTTVVVVEQDIRQALAAADRVYCLLEGRVALEGVPADLDRDRIAAAYFGVRA